MNYLLKAFILLLTLAGVNGQDLIGSRGIIGEIELLNGYEFGEISGKGNQDMISLRNGKYAKTFIFIDYDGLNPHQYLLGEKLGKIGNIHWIKTGNDDYCGIIDGPGWYISFEFNEFSKGDPTVVSMMTSIVLTNKKSAQQGDAPEPASPAR